MSTGTTLVLNADMTPMSLLPVISLRWEDAIRQWYKGELEIIVNYDDWVVHSPSISVQVPAVVKLKEHINVKRRVKFSRYNLFLRDDFTCQYCGDKFHDNHKGLSFDHVIPRAKGGKTVWKNIVAACHQCNTEKGMKSIEPINKPAAPNYYQLVNKIRKTRLRIPHESWQDYLMWDENKIDWYKPNFK